MTVFVLGCTCVVETVKSPGVAGALAGFVPRCLPYLHSSDLTLTRWKRLMAGQIRSSGAEDSNHIVVSSRFLSSSEDCAVAKEHFPTSCPPPLWPLLKPQTCPNCLRVGHFNMYSLLAATCPPRKCQRGGPGYFASFPGLILKARR